MFYFCVMENSLISLFIPQEILAYFELDYYASFCKLGTKDEGYIIHIREKNILPEGYIPDDYESKGFDKPVLIQDFPIRGKLIYFSLVRRRWRHKVDKNRTIKRSFDFLGQGVQMTQELVDFLKGSDRDPGRYDDEYL